MDKAIDNLQPEDTKQFLTTVKELLGDFQEFQSKQPSNEQSVNGFAALVRLYLKCPSKFSSKRVISSFFQKCSDENQAHIQGYLCTQLVWRFSADCSKTSDVKHIRQTVDNIHSLLENSAFGEGCIQKVFHEVLQFLTQAEDYFLSQVNKDVPPVYLNEVMHHCLVTMQALNLVLQKTVVDNADRMEQFSGDIKLLDRLVEIDIRIIQNELLLLDCRCCCAMNVFLLIQISSPLTDRMELIPHLLFPRKVSSVKIINAMSKLIWLSKKVFFFNMSNQSPLSFLAIAFGYIAVNTAKNISEEAEHGHFFFTDELLPKLLSHGKICEDTMSKAHYGKTINLWTTKLNTCIGNFPVSVGMAQRLQGDSDVIQSLLEYVWTHWEDQLDVIRQSAKMVFENVIKMHMAADKSGTESPSPFISLLLSKLFKVSWTSRGKFSALSSCVTFVGARSLLEQRSNFPAEVLSQFEDKSLACHATELYTNTLQSHRKELSTLPPIGAAKKEDAEVAEVKYNSVSQRNEDCFSKTWIEPVITVLCSSSKNMKNNVIEYLLPRLLKSDKNILDHILNTLSASESHNGENGLKYGAVVACLRRARVMGILSAFPVPGKDCKPCYGVMYAEVIKTTLCVLDEQMRLDAFAFLCESSKTTEAVTSSEFEMLRLFIKSNLNSQSPAFRQNFLSLLKKLFTRIHESLPPLLRVARREKLDVSEYVDNYKAFLEWIASLMLSNLHPGGAFARRTNCLSCLCLMDLTFSLEVDNFSLSSFLNESGVETLLKCFADTYEDNKVDSLKILTTHAGLVGRVSTVPRLLSLLQTSLNLACSTKPQDCSTAAYIMLLLIKQRDSFSLIKGHDIELKTNTAKEMLFKINAMFSLNQLPGQTSGDSTPVSQGYATIYLLHILLVYLHDQTEVAKQSLITAAANRPMYPTLQCIRYIMQEIKWQSYPSELVILGRHFVQLLIKICLDLARVVSPVVQNSSPEGNIPAEAIMGPGLNLADILPKLDVGSSTALTSKVTDSTSNQSPNMSKSVIQSQMLVESMPEYLVVCCWRSIKEVSLTLGKMCLQVPITAMGPDQHISENSSSSILSLKTIHSVGEYFTEQLLESIHRGAFELAYVGFQLMCQMLWSHPHSAFHNLPNQWLMKVICDIKSEDPNSKLCATRRSAGVPFFIQAITSSEPVVHGRQCFHNAMKELIIFALNESINDGRNEFIADAQVHALNILRALYKDSRLREDVVPYIADGVRAAIRGFKSSLWSVRNSATLLLSALMTRMFGVKRSKDETVISKKNCQTGRSFFYHYPSLYSFLLTELEEATRSVGPENSLKLHPSLYPILLILGRLFPSMLEGSDTSLSLSAFIPYVLKCASSPVLKTRIIAARALQPLARRNQIIEVAKQLFVNIPQNSKFVSLPSSSHMHGSLLQLCELMKLVTDLNTSLQVRIVCFFADEMMSHTWLLTLENQCFATRQCALHLVDYILSITRVIGSSLAENERESVKRLKAQFITSLSLVTCEEDRWKPLVYEYERSRAILSLKHLRELEPSVESDSSGTQRNKEWQKKIVLNFLKSPFYEVRLQILLMFISSFTGSGSSILGSKEIEGGERDDKDSISGGGPQETAVMSGIAEHTLTESVYSSLDHETRAALKIISPDLFDDLLHMAVEVENHHECLEKVFYVLAYIPCCGQLLLRRDTASINKIFTCILQKMKEERRNEVKAAMLRFTGCFVPFLHDSIKSGNASVQFELFTQWTHLVQECSQTEDYPDLQISVCHVLMDNATILLGDGDQRPDLLSFHFWNILASLLQEDDLDVKDIAASILAVSIGLSKGSLHPNYALEKLPEIFVRVHKNKRLCDLTEVLVTWVLQDDISDVKEQNENLFDKSEMNTYHDYIAFTRCVIQALTSLFHDKNYNAKDTPACSDDKNERFIKELHSSDLIDFLIQAFERIDQELNSLRAQCQPTDALVNPAQHVSLCQAIFRARSLISVFKGVFKNENAIQMKIRELDITVSNLMEEVDVCDSFCP